MAVVFLRSGRHISSTEMLAAQTLKIANINGLGNIDKLETELEDEILWEENRRPPREIIGRARRRCEEILHSKKMLLVIVVLNIVDCLLVVGELTLDFHQVTSRFMDLSEHSEEFLGHMQDTYRPTLDDVEGTAEDVMTDLFDRFLRSFVFWDAFQYSADSLAADCQPFVASYSNSSNTSAVSGSANHSNPLMALLAFTSQPQEKEMRPLSHEHLKHEQVAHILHYISIGILTFLLAETILKIVSVGKRFLKKRMEMFDAVVVTISFTLDVVFAKGLTSHNMQNFVIILSFLLPWRVLRVLNSLIVALMDQHRFHLKVLYKQKRKMTKQYNEAVEHVKVLEKKIDALTNLCKQKGCQDWELHRILHTNLSSNSSHGGLKALSKLMFQAAGSFAHSGSGSGSKLNCAGGNSSAPSSPSGKASNGHVSSAVGKARLVVLDEDPKSKKHRKASARPKSFSGERPPLDSQDRIDMARMVCNGHAYAAREATASVETVPDVVISDGEEGVLPESKASSVSSGQDTLRQPPGQDTASKPSGHDTSSQTLDHDTSSQPPDQDSSSQSPDHDTPSQPPGQDISNQPHEQDTSNHSPSQGTSSHPPGQDTSSHRPGQDASSQSPGQDASSQSPGQDVSSHPPGQDVSSQAPGQDSASLFPDQNTTSNPPGQDSASLFPDQNTTSNPPGQDSASLFPDQNTTSNPPGENDQSSCQGTVGQLSGQNRSSTNVENKEAALVPQPSGSEQTNSDKEKQHREQPVPRSADGNTSLVKDDSADSEHVTFYLSPDSFDTADQDGVRADEGIINVRL